MTSVLGSALHSEPIPPTSSNRRSNEAPFSSRRGPEPSEGEFPSEAGFADDEVAVPARGRNANPLDRNVQRIEDTSAKAVGMEFQRFLETHEEEPASSGLPQSSELRTNKYYINQIHGLKEFQLSTLYVDYKHILAYKGERGNEGQLLADWIAAQYYRFLPYLTQALHRLLAKYEPVYFKDHRQMASSNTAKKYLAE